MKPIRESFLNYNPDTLPMPVVALHSDVLENEKETPVHQHHKGQLTIALQGSVTGSVPGGLWLVPPKCGIWVPAGVPHSNSFTKNGRICFLYIEADAAKMPDVCCTLSLSPLVLALILHFAAKPQEYTAESKTGRLVQVLLDELMEMKVEQLHLPVSENTKLRKVTDTLTENPADRRTIAEWAKETAMSERTFARFFLKETGMTFGRWRQQLHIIMALGWLAAGQSVQNVSADLGYESVSAFITMFKKMLGQSPTKYLAQRRRQSFE